MDLYEFLADYGIIGFSISTALGLSFFQIMKNISSEFTIPIIGALLNIKDFKNLHINVANQDIYLGKLISNILAYLSIIGIIFLLSRLFFHKLITNVSKQKNLHKQNLLKEQEKTSNLLQKINQKQNKIYGMKGFQYI